MGLLHKVTHYWKKINDSRETDRIKQEVELDEIALSVMKHCLEKESISCRCLGMAIPVWDTSNKYHCLKCGSRFANSRHNIVYEISRYDIFSSIGSSSRGSFMDMMRAMQAESETRSNRRVEFYDKAVDELKERYR